MENKILIIGAGLTGLTLGYKLKQQDIPFKILEAQDRSGGRINTTHSARNTPIDMGATWFGKKHKKLIKLLNELDLTTFKQFTKGITLFEPISVAPPQRFDIPESEEPSYRIAGGTQALTNKLADNIGESDIKLNENVQSVCFSNDRFEIATSGNRYHAHKVVSTLPPRLLVNTIDFNPGLPQKLAEVAQNTHTWMGDAIKFGLSYEYPFWVENNYSGTAFSNVGPVTELYDHSNYENNRYALKGFLQPHMYHERKESRKQKILEQLKKFFGETAENYLAYEEKVWRNEPATSFESSSFIAPHANNGHPVYSKTYFDEQFHISGSETAVDYGGYMEGAVASAYQTFKNLLR